MYAQSVIANLLAEMRSPDIPRAKEAVPVGERAWGATLETKIWKTRKPERLAIMKWMGSCTMAPVRMKLT
jgi:hypothetical protein